MSVSGSDLVTPVMLMAMPQVLDPFFHRSVVLLLHHEDEGSFGFIVNRPTGIKVGEIRHKDPVETWSGGFAPGLDPERRPYASLAELTDPDGNSWTLQEIKR